MADALWAKHLASLLIEQHAVTIYESWIREQGERNGRIYPAWTNLPHQGVSETDEFCRDYWRAVVKNFTGNIT